MDIGKWQIDLNKSIFDSLHDLKFIWLNSSSCICICSNLQHFCTPLYLHSGQKILDAHNDVVKNTICGTVLVVRLEPWPQCRYHRTSDLWIVLGPSIPATPTVLGWWMLLPNKGFKWKWMIWLLPKMPEKWWFTYVSLMMYYKVLMMIYHMIYYMSYMLYLYISLDIGVLGWRNNIPKNSGNILTLDWNMESLDHGCSIVSKWKSLIDASTMASENIWNKVGTTGIPCWKEKQLQISATLGVNLCSMSELKILWI